MKPHETGTPPRSTDARPPAAEVADDERYGFGDDDLKEMSLRLAHSIRNPLATIKSAIQLVQRLRLDPDSAARYLDSVVHEVGRITDTLAIMEDYIRLSARAPRPVSVRSAAGVLAAEVGDSPAPIRISCGESLAVAIDPGHLEMALRDLISNAGRFAPPGTTIEIGAEQRADGTTAVWVEDGGPGIAPEIADRVLRPFYSVSTQGVGLGLNRVQKICRMAGGRLDWCNLPERGCRFTMVLPGA